MAVHGTAGILDKNLVKLTESITKDETNIRTEIFNSDTSGMHKSTLSDIDAAYVEEFKSGISNNLSAIKKKYETIEKIKFDEELLGDNPLASGNAPRPRNPLLCKFLAR